MGNANRTKSSTRCLMSAFIIALLAACGGGGTGSGDSNPQDAVVPDTSGQASAVASIAADPGTPEFTPTPGNGLPTSYQDPVQVSSSNDEYIAAQWEHMQTCLLVSAQEPEVVVVDGKLEPTDLNDDVVRHIDGQIQASAHVTDTSATIQVRAQDFDGSLGSEGAYLRSIMGRYLWLANNLAERDYPYNCAMG